MLRTHYFAVNQQSDLASFLKERLPTFAIDELIQLGAVYVDRVRHRQPSLVQPGQQIRIHLEPKRYPTQSVSWRQTIVFESAHFILVNKPHGIPVHPMLDNYSENLLVSLSQEIKQPLWLVHRLDVDTQGLLLLAKSQDQQKLMAQIWHSPKVRRLYRALVWGLPSLGLYTHYMTPSARAPKTLSQKPSPDALVCEMRILRVTPISDQFSEVEIELLTGRTHQIRAQLAFLSHPVVNDSMYGQRPYNCICPFLGLQSFSLLWTEPEGRFLFQLPASWGKSQK